MDPLAMASLEVYAIAEAEVTLVMREDAVGVTDERVGTVVSMVMDRFEDTVETLPAESVCFAFMVVCAPSDNVEAAIVTVDEAQVPEPTEVTLSYNVTVLPVTQEIVNDGVTFEVMLSVADVPLSVPAVMSGVPGAESAVASMVIDRFDEAVETLPAGSVCLAFMVE